MLEVIPLEKVRNVTTIDNIIEDRKESSYEKTIEKNNSMASNISNIMSNYTDDSIWSRK